MSSRFERAADKKLLEKHQQILKELVSRPENKICADCKRRGRSELQTHTDFLDPRWASANLGIFVCLRCSGIHRSLGVHISKVRSVDLDTWTQEHIDNMLRWGNQKANMYWEARLDAGYQVDEARMESFVRSKYEAKKYAKPCTPEEYLKGLEGVNQVSHRFTSCQFIC
jgi:stromal membrane-associated protein